MRLQAVSTPKQHEAELGLHDSFFGLHRIDLESQDTAQNTETLCEAA